MAEKRLKRLGLRTSQKLVEAAQIAVGEKPKPFDLAKVISKMPTNYQPEEIPSTMPLGKEEW